MFVCVLLYIKVKLSIYTVTHVCTTSLAIPTICDPQPVSCPKDGSPLRCHVNCTLAAANCCVAYRCCQWLLETLVLNFSLHLTSCSRHFK